MRLISPHYGFIGHRPEVVCQHRSSISAVYSASALRPKEQNTKYDKFHFEAQPSIFPETEGASAEKTGLCFSPTAPFYPHPLRGSKGGDELMCIREASPVWHTVSFIITSRRPSNSHTFIGLGTKTAGLGSGVGQMKGWR